VNGLAALEKEDEPTLILLTDAVNLSAADYHDLCQQSLAQCNKLGDRFCIFDVKDKSSANDHGVRTSATTRAPTISSTAQHTFRISALP
jgi:hypothetical protein